MKKVFTFFFFLLSVILLEEVGAQSNIINGYSSEPSVIQYTSPNRDVLNCDNILVFYDFNPGLNLVQTALQQLGCSYTLYNDDRAGFETALTTGTWDIVIFDEESFGSSPSLYDALNNYVLGGGRLIFDSWNVLYISAHPLWNTLGFNYVNYIDAQMPVYWWVPTHAFFNSPNSVPQLTVGTEYTNVDGQVLTVLPGFQVLAGFTTPGPDPFQEAMIFGNNGKTVFLSFMPNNFPNDVDGDLVPDMSELYANLVKGLCEGIEPLPLVPLSPWAIIIGVGLILAFTVIRFRRLS